MSVRRISKGRRPIANSSPADVTRWLHAWRQGDADALGQLLPLVYDQLHRLAHGHIRREWAGQTLQTTALVHEAYLRLVAGKAVEWNDRAHFFAVCARLMRRILVDRARARATEKRGGGAVRVEVEALESEQPAKDAEILALDEALTRLAAADPRRSQVVELRYFGGLTIDETAAVLDVSRGTVARDWKVARLWLLHELKDTAKRPCR